MVRVSDGESQQRWGESAMGRVSWPPLTFTESDEKKALMEARERELLQISGPLSRLQSWRQHAQSRLVHNYTQLGFKVVSTPPPIQAALAASLAEFVDDTSVPWAAKTHEAAGTRGVVHVRSCSRATRT